MIASPQYSRTRWDGDEFVRDDFLQSSLVGLAATNDSVVPLLVEAAAAKDVRTHTRALATLQTIGAVRPKSEAIKAAVPTLIKRLDHEDLLIAGLTAAALHGIVMEKELRDLVPNSGLGAAQELATYGKSPWQRDELRLLAAVFTKLSQ